MNPTMNFWMLKNMVENILQNYSCPYCGAKDMDERHIDIMGAAGNTVNIDINCPSCKRHFMAKTEVMQLDMGNISSEKLASIQNALQALKWKLGGNIEVDMTMMQGAEKEQISQEDAILDTEIRDLQKTLSKKGNMQVDDLFLDEAGNEST